MEGGKDVHMLIITDHFILYAQALVTSLQIADCIARALWDLFIVHYGLPESKGSDQGQNLRVTSLQSCANWQKYKKLYTSPYHLQTNWQCKCFNHTLNNMLGTLAPNKKCSWRDIVPMLVHAYNCTRHTAMRFSPYYLMYGQKPQLLVYWYFGTPKSRHECHYPRT